MIQTISKILCDLTETKKLFMVMGMAMLMGMTATMGMVMRIKMRIATVEAEVQKTM